MLSFKSNATKGYDLFYKPSTSTNDFMLLMTTSVNTNTSFNFTGLSFG